MWCTINVWVRNVNACFLEVILKFQLQLVRVAPFSCAMDFGEQNTTQELLLCNFEYRPLMLCFTSDISKRHSAPPQQPHCKIIRNFELYPEFF